MNQLKSCTHSWTKQIDKGWDGTCTEYRKCTTCGLSNMYMGISNEEAEELEEKCTQETFYEPEPWEHNGEKYVVSLNNGLFIPLSAEVTATHGTHVSYEFKYSASTPLKFDTSKNVGFPVMKVSPHSALGKNLVKHG